MTQLALRIATRYKIRTAFERTLVAFGVKDLEKLYKSGRQFGVVSAYRTGLSISQNKKRQAQLLKDIQAMGYKVPISIKSSWTDIDTGEVAKERSFLIPDIEFEDIKKLSDKYEQDAFIYKDPSGTIGIYDKRGEATMAFDKDGDMSISTSLDRDSEYSGMRSLSFSLNLVEDRKFKYKDTPITKNDVIKSLEKKPLEGGSGESKKKDKGEGAEGKTWDDFLRLYYDGGKKKVPNPNPKTKDRYPEVSLSTALGNSKFRSNIMKQYKRWVETQP